MLLVTSLCLYRPGQELSRGTSRDDWYSSIGCRHGTIDEELNSNPKKEMDSTSISGPDLAGSPARRLGIALDGWPLERS